MKNLLPLYLLCALVALSSCGKDDDIDDNNNGGSGGSGSSSSRIASVSSMDSDGLLAFTAEMEYESGRLSEQVFYGYYGSTAPEDSALTVVSYDGGDIQLDSFEEGNGEWELFSSEIRTVQGGRLTTSQFYADGVSGGLSSQTDYMYEGDRLTERVSTSFFDGYESEQNFTYVYVNDRLSVREQRNADGTLVFRINVNYTGSNATSTDTEFNNLGQWDVISRVEYDYSNGRVTEERGFSSSYIGMGEMEQTYTSTYVYDGSGRLVTSTYADADGGGTETSTVTYESGADNLDDVFSDPETGLVFFGPSEFE